MPYEPPTAAVFGTSQVELPSASASGGSSSFDRPRNRPKLQDRLAQYEDDNPRFQQCLCVAGIFLPPLWCIGAICYFMTPANKVLTREVGFKNFVLFMLFGTLVCFYLAYHFFLEK